MTKHTSKHPRSHRRGFDRCVYNLVVYAVFWLVVIQQRNTNILRHLRLEQERQDQCHQRRNIQLNSDLQ